MNVFFIFFKRVYGIFLILLSLFILTCLLWYNSADPSFNTATTFAHHGICGILGSYIADAMWQWIGVISFPFLLSLFLLGVACFFGEEIKYFFIRALLQLISLLALSLGIYYVEIGNVGILPNLYRFIGIPLSDFDNNRYLISIGLIALAILFYIFSLGLRFSLKVAEKMKLFIIIVFSFFFRRHQSLSKQSDDDNSEELNPEDVVDIIEDKDHEKCQSEISNSKRKAYKIKKVSSNVKYKAPSLDFLTTPKDNSDTYASKEAMLEMGKKLQEAMQEYKISGEIVGFKSGPVVTLFEFAPAKGVSIRRIINQSPDIARAMCSSSIRISPIPGTILIGVEIPNKTRKTVLLKELLVTDEFKKAKEKLCLALGKDIMGHPVYANLEKMPHLLVAGTTGSGKSVAINTIIMSLLYRLGPDECKLIMVDPKMLELSIYNGIPHLLTPVITEPAKVVSALKWAVKEMNNRYQIISSLNVRNMEAYNEKVKKMREENIPMSRTVKTGFDADGKPIVETIQNELKPMPYIVIIIDEMADLMIFAKKDINNLIQSLAQKARASGIHVITATQRPSVDVITGVIKTNFPARISFQVTSGTDSRTILDEMGAEQLLGMGDMLYKNGQRPIRIQCPFVSDKEVEDISNYLRSIGSADYIDAITAETSEETSYGSSHDENSGKDDIYNQAVNIVRNDRKVSISYIQRRLSIGYNRAATLVERMEAEGLISQADSTGKREILIN